jgi:CspA family cold shock protein
MSERFSGVVRWFSAERGFGFATRDDGLPDVFLPAIALQSRGLNSVTKGQRITYALKPGKQGRAATAYAVAADPTADDMLVRNTELTPTESPYDEV